MISRVAGAPLPASVPPSGLTGLDPSWSRLVPAVDGSGDDVVWHLLDTAAQLEKLGVSPVGAVLCVHGNPTWSYLWRELVSQSLARAAEGEPAWRVIAVDQLEMGFSERTGRRRTLADRVADLGALTETLELDGPVATLGHDWGGVVSMGWAVDHGPQLAGLALLNTAIHQPDSSPIPAPLRLALLPAVLEASTVSTPGFLETTLALGHPRLSRTVKDGYRAPYRTAARRDGIGGFVADIPVDESSASTRELDRIAAALREVAVPSLMLWGPEDPIFSDRYLDDLIDRVPHAEVHRFEGAGHLIAEDVDYAAAVLDWLGEKVVPTASASAAPSSDTVAPMPAARTRRPLWHHLDALRDSREVALVEMAPPSGDSPRSVSWALLSKRVRQLAAGLTAHGVRRGDRVSLLVPPGADLTAALYACLRIGAVVVVADAGLGLQGLTRAVRGAHPDYVIGALPGLSAARALGWPGQRISTTRLSAPLRASLGLSTSVPDLVDLGAGEALPAEPPVDAVAAVLFTSGSTGPAKGVVYAHAQLEALRDVLAAQYGVGVGTGLVAGFAPFALLGPALGARTVTPEMDVTSPKTLTARAVADAIGAVDATVLFLSPAAIANVVATAGALTDADGPILARVHTALSAGAPVPAALLERLREVLPFAVAHTPYGMTEGLLMTDITLDGIHDAESSHVGGGVCVGRPVEGVHVLISALDDDGSASGDPTTSADLTGEIIVSAPHLKLGYDRLARTDRAAVAGTPTVAPGSDTRWHRTGDVGHFDDEGRLWVEGRLPHVIVTSDSVITPVAPEQRIENLRDVSRAAVVGVGPRGVQQIVAIVETQPAVRRPRLASPGLAAAVRDAADVPLAAVLLVPHLPTDIRHNSKIDRIRLSSWAEAVLSGERMTAP